MAIFVFLQLKLMTKEQMRNRLSGLWILMNSTFGAIGTPQLKNSDELKKITTEYYNLRKQYASLENGNK